MKFYLDTANISEIREVASWGLLDGVTTNPTLIAKVKKDFKTVILEICELVPGRVNAEVIATDTRGIITEGREFHKLHEKIVVKIPLTKEGIRAGNALCNEGVPVNFTLCFSANQALLAAKVGASYITPFVGRLDYAGQYGMELVQQIRTIIDNYSFKMEIVVGSVRHPTHVLESALAGADIATMPYATMESLFNHPMTEMGLEIFLSDWKKYQESLK